jgi:hypothetical protein
MMALLMLGFFCIEVDFAVVILTPLKTFLYYGFGP